MAAPTYYDILGVKSSATAEEIRRAYRSKAKSLHPDVSPAPGAQAQFAALARAYETLSDRTKRRAYDTSLNEPPTSRRTKGPRGEHQAHYTWTNIATDSTDKPDRLREFDELYETFFMPHAPAKPRTKKPT